MPNKAILRLTHGGFLWWGSAGVLIVAGAVLTYAIELQEWRLAQVASMVGVALIIAGVALLGLHRVSPATRRA